MKYLLKHCHLIVDSNREYLDGALLINEDIIEDIYYQSNKIPEIDSEYELVDLGGKLLMPGFFDSHCHGANLICFDNCNKEEMDELSLQFAKDGTTSFLATLSNDLGYEQINKQLKEFENYQSPYSHFQGFHIEGPFLSEKYPGMADINKFNYPDIDVVKQFINNSSKIKQMTIAYELDGAKDIGQLLHEHNIKVMCGHSDAVMSDLDENIDGFTHLFNAMRPLHHRDITLVNCAFMNKWYVEVIADGIHLDENILRLIINNIDDDLIMLISDSSVARNMPDGDYTFISKLCHKQGSVFKTADNHLAGSVVSINDEMKILKKLGCKYTQLLEYSSLNAFRFYGLDKKYGTLDKGKYADIVIMDDDLNIERVYVKGSFIDA